MNGRLRQLEALELADVEIPCRTTFATRALQLVIVGTWPKRHSSKLVVS